MSRRVTHSRKVYRILGGAAFFLLGGMTAVALADAREPQHGTGVAQAAVPAVAADRILVSPAAVRQAYADGLIDRPIKSVLKVPDRMQYGDYRWDDKGVPQGGETWIRVDLKSQILSVFRSGHEIGTTVILYGADSVPTPVGRFPVLAKIKDHRSATYDAPMPYTLRLTADGVSIHASNVRWGYATHGCIGVPAGFAAKLFAVASVGDDVLVVDGANRS
jgi:lipoprotein-anchoring transpeptidase ErfK/SrfK